MVAEAPYRGDQVLHERKGRAEIAGPEMALGIFAQRLQGIRSAGPMAGLAKRQNFPKCIHRPPTTDRVPPDR